MDEKKSKSQKKRDADALQKLGTKLTALSTEKLAELPLTDQLRHAINEAKTLKSHGAIRRQSQLIGKLMRTASEYDNIYAAYETLQAAEQSQTIAFHAVEQWRKKLLDEGKSALTQFIKEYPCAEPQTLRQLIKKTIKEQSLSQNTGAYKQLFRYIRSCLS